MHPKCHSILDGTISLQYELGRTNNNNTNSALTSMFGHQDEFLGTSNVVDWEALKTPSSSRRTATTTTTASKASTTTTGTTSPIKLKNPFIRGVNLGGWLLLERFITPYMFALTDCHIKGDFCWFPNQISAPSVDSNEHQYCDMFHCDFLLNDDKTDFVAMDEYTLASQFSQKALAREYLSYHYDNFVTKLDIETLKDVGVTHVRVPIPHWIMGDIRDDEPWVDGQWLYFVRLVGWCREVGIQVWPDIHTAPGSQNGFDNSGQSLNDAPTCRHWSSSPERVKRSLKAVNDIAKAVVRDNLGDVVTGFGILNEPFSDCDVSVVKQFYNEAVKAVRTTMGKNTSVYIGDMFNSSNWNNGWWTDEDEFTDTFLDSHYYHVFDGNDRPLSPKQHVALACGKDTRATQSCCYHDAPKNTIPSKGITRLIGEWSAAYDSEPKYRLHDIIGEIIKKKGDTANFVLPNNRTQSKERQDFLRYFVQAQMVTYESASTVDKGVGLSRGWFYWTLKMEFGSLAEWDFLRGYKEGWIPTLPSPSESSESVFGTCREIAEKTKDDESVVEEFPDPETHPYLWGGPVVDDDFVLSHAGSLPTKTGETKKSSSEQSKGTSANKAPTGTSKTTTQESEKKTASPHTNESETKKASTEQDEEEDADKKSYKAPSKSGLRASFPIFCLVFFVWAIWKVFLQQGNPIRNRRQYTSIDAPTQLSV